jgi:hypothetical protein
LLGIHFFPGGADGQLFVVATTTLSFAFLFFFFQHCNGRGTERLLAFGEHWWRVMDGHNVDNEDTRTIRLGGIKIG